MTKPEQKRDPLLSPTPGNQEPDPDTPGDDFDLVDEASLESFPASDAPAWITRDTKKT